METHITKTVPHKYCIMFELYSFSGQCFNIKSHYRYNNTHTVLHTHAIGQMF